MTLRKSNKDEFTRENQIMASSAFKMYDCSMNVLTANVPDF